MSSLYLLIFLNPLTYCFGIILSLGHPYHLAITIVLLVLIGYAVRNYTERNLRVSAWAFGTALLWRVLHLAIYLVTYKEILPSASRYTWNLGGGMPSVAQAGWPEPLMLPVGAGGGDRIPFDQLIWAYHNEVFALLSAALIALLFVRILSTRHLASLLSHRIIRWGSVVVAVMAHLAFAGAVLLWFD
jgi:hypothetical protein